MISPKSALLLFAIGCLLGLANESMAQSVADDLGMMDQLTVYADPTVHPGEDKPFTLTEPFKHYHLSKLGSPYIYSFTTQPAFTGRDFFLNHRYRNGNGVTEQQLDAQLNWAITQQIGLFAEIPYIRENINGSPAKTDFGKLSLTPRATILETERFLVALKSEFGLPIGNTTLDNDTTIAPGVIVWTDLGNWFTLSSEISVEHEFDTEDKELQFNLALIKSDSGKFAHTCVDGECDHSGDRSQINYHLELMGSTPIDGDDRGDVSLESLIGVSLNLSESFDIRAGYIFPLSTPHEINHGFTTGLIYRF